MLPAVTAGLLQSPAEPRRPVRRPYPSQATDRGSKPCPLSPEPEVRIHLPPALSHVRTRLPRSVGRLASTCGYHCPLGGSGLPGCGCPYAGHLGCFPSGSIGAARSLQVMIFVIRFLLFVARPRRSGSQSAPGLVIWGIVRR